MLLLTPASVGAAEPVALEGKTLAEALLSLQQQGLKIVFSDRLVEPGMRVIHEPGGETPQEVLNALLAPHGLEVEKGAGGTLVVVRGGEGEGAVEPSRYFGEEIVVRPSEWAVLQEEPVAPLSMDRDEVRALPHLGDDVFRALSLLPGVSSNDATAALTVHGGRRDEVLILLDGQELYDAFHLKDFDSALSIVPAEGLAGVSLSTGAFPASSGDRMGGVLELTTRRPAARRRTRLGVSLLHAQLSSSGLFAAERGTWLASARRGSVDLATRLLGDEDPSFWDAFAKVGFDLKPGHRLTAHALVADDRLEFQETLEDEDRRFSTDYGSFYLWLTHQGLLGDRLLVETSASVSGFDRDRRGREEEEEKAFEIADLRDVEVVEASQSWVAQVGAGRWGDHTWKWGAHARRFDARYDYVSGVEPTLVIAAPFESTPVGDAAFFGDFRGEHLGLFVADRLPMGERLTLELGVRYDRHTLTDDTLLSPRINAAWRLGEAGVLRASWGHFFQTQRPYELEIQDGETEFAAAERSVHTVLGYEALLGLGSDRRRPWLEALRLELYRREISDPRPRYENLFEPLNIFPEIEGGRVRLEPAGSRAEGIELGLRGHLGAYTDWRLNYAYARVWDRLPSRLNSSGFRRVRRQTDQPHTLNLVLHQRLGKHWTLALAWRYHTGWPTTPVGLELFDDEDELESGEEESEGPVGALVLGPLNGDRLEDYHRLDLRLARSWDLRRGRLSFFVDVQNLYDHENLAGFDLSADEDSGSLEVEEERWVGTLPSLGFAWEF